MLPSITGSSIYYSSLAAPLKQRDLFVACHLFCETLMNIAECYKEKSVAEGKLVWWCQEIERLQDKKPTHPISKSLLNTFEYGINATPFKAIVDSAKTAIKTELFSNSAELHQHYQHTGGIIEAVKAQIIWGRELNTDELKACHQLGIALECIRHLNIASEHIHRGLEYFPDSYHDQASHAKILINNISVKLTRAQRVYTNIQLKLLAKIERDKFQVEQYQYALSPLQKLITLWRTR